MQHLKKERCMIRYIWDEDELNKMEHFDTDFDDCIPQPTLPQFRERKNTKKKRDQGKETKIQIRGPLHWRDGYMRAGIVPTGTAEVLKYLHLNKEETETAFVIISLVFDSEDHSRAIHSDVLMRLFPNAYQRTKKVIQSLIKGTEEGPIIVREAYSYGEHPFIYSISEKYAKRRGQKIQFREAHRISPRMDENKDFFLTPICRYLHESYSHFELPEIKELKNIAEHLNGSMLKTSHGLKEAVYLKKRHQNRNKYTEIVKTSKKNEPPANRIRLKDGFVVLDDGLNRYRNLLNAGCSLPHRNENCARVYDSFSSLPKWIRSEIRIDGEKLVELDFSSLHPNLIFYALYPYMNETEKNEYEKIKGDMHGHIAQELITNKMVDESTYSKDLKGKSGNERETIFFDLVRRDVKIAHLSFFNTQYVTSPKLELINRYYSMKFPDFYWKLESMKHGAMIHKRVSHLLFSLESDLMGRIVSEFHKRGIPGIYIFDALAVSMSRIDEARSIMNQIAKELEIGARVGIFKTIQSIAA